MSRKFDGAVLTVKSPCRSDKHENVLIAIGIPHSGYFYKFIVRVVDPLTISLYNIGMTETTLNRDFLLGGKAAFVIKNPAGNKFEFSVRKGKPTEQYPNPSYFVSLRDGNHPKSRYGSVYMGLLDSQTGKIRHTRNSNFGPDSTEFKVAQWAITLIGRGEKAPDGYTLNHTGKCGVCGRKLTDEESVKTGIGPICRDKVTAPSGNYNPMTGHYDEPTGKQFEGE